MNAKERKAATKLFYTALDHIIAQGKPSINIWSYACRYRGPNNTKCAFGPAIKKYSKAMEGKQADKLLKEWADNLFVWVLDCPTDFAVRVQIAHDDLSRYTDGFVPEFKANMQGIANSYPELNLKVPH